MKLFSMLNSTVYEVSTAHKKLKYLQKEVSCSLSLKCGILRGTRILRGFLHENLPKINLPKIFMFNTVNLTPLTYH